ncbi:TPA: recombinase family protein [Citrobacter koseri]|nr:recombinase family protein [Citrobacter koseri]
MRSFLYCTICPGEQQEFVAEHHTFIEICKAFHIPHEQVVIEQVDTEEAVTKQRLLRQLINYEMNRQDTLVILDLSCLGRTVADLQETLFFCLQKDIFIYSYHPDSRIEPSAESCVSFLIARQNTIDIHNLKSTKSRYRHVKKPLGRKEGSKYRNDITKLKSAGYSQAETAKKLGISLSTVKRHWNNGIIG